MRIMLVNDDGYRARGINALGRALISAGHEVVVCAPDRERSSAGHSFTFGRPLAAEPFAENGLTGYAISGTPADAAQLGLHLLKKQVDMVISGINHGPNMGGACVYSGTVSAAMEASMGGVPALAVSLGDYGSQGNFEAAALVAVKVAEWMVQRPLAKGEIYNLNVPDLPYDEIKGVRRARLSRDFLCSSVYEEHKMPEGTRYVARFGEFEANTDPECDSVLFSHGWATLSALTWDMISKNEMEVPEIEL